MRESQNCYLSHALKVILIQGGDARFYGTILAIGVPQIVSDPPYVPSSQE
jgi:hypothetical protein